MILTIFTPTYNRMATLPRLYESLAAQNATDFEWLVVDDGSSDDTPRLLQRYMEEASFPIRYERKENGGKHTAYNRGLELAEGDYFFCVDSDDLLAPGAVRQILQAANLREKNRGIVAYKEDLSGRRLSEEFPSELESCPFYELSLVHGCSGEFSLVFPTELARQFPFPVFEGERFVTESVVYDRIQCEMRLLPVALTVCEYQSDGYSNDSNALMVRNPKGYCLYFLQRIDLMPGFKNRLVCAGKYWCFRWISGSKTLRYSGEHRFALLAGWFAGVAFRLYYKLVRGF